jgi:hypothetical protein
VPDDERSARGQSKGGRLGFVVTACLASAALVTPIAIGATGSPLREGVRNPFSASATRESLIIARTAANVYGTRQSNVGAGGAAIYGCRTTEDLGALGDTVKSTPCLRVNNLSTGLIFAYRFSRGSVGGVYQAGPTAANDPRARPFITNATGIATGLNAARVDSLEADDIIAAIRATGEGAQGPKGPAGDKGATGPAGPPGIAGARGQWFSGANAPTPDLAGTQPGDFYLDLVDPDRGNVYIKTDSNTWVSPKPGEQLNIAGPAGLPADLTSQQNTLYVNQVVADYCNANANCDQTP